MFSKLSFLLDPYCLELQNFYLFPPQIVDHLEGNILHGYRLTRERTQTLSTRESTVVSPILGFPLLMSPIFDVTFHKKIASFHIMGAVFQWEKGIWLSPHAHRCIDTGMSAHLSIYEVCKCMHTGMNAQAFLLPPWSLPLLLLTALGKSSKQALVPLLCSSVKPAWFSLSMDW